MKRRAQTDTTSLVSTIVSLIAGIVIFRFLFGLFA